MHRSRNELMKQTPLVPYYTETSMPFHFGNENRGGAVAGTVHRILALAFVCFDAWLKPLFSREEIQNPSPIQECDPYLLGLLQYLQSHRRD
jgi:hypothetical protein